MIGVDEMFAEYSGWQQREFEYQFSVERAADRIRECNRIYQRTRRAVVKANPVLREEKRQYHRRYTREYMNKRRANDAEFKAKLNKKAREGMARLYARRKAEKQRSQYESPLCA